MRWAISGVGAVVLFGWSSVATAAPIELVEQRDQFMLFDDVDQSVQQGNFFSRDPFLSVYGDIEGGFLAVHPDDSQFIVVYTTWNLPAGIGALYQAVANDVEGIGYQHAADFDPIIPAEIFDDTPDSQVQGFLHMNDWTQYLGDDPGGVDDRLISLIFGQELGHAWLAFVHVAGAGQVADSMLGRSQAHWSFYLDSGGSPVEGHDWTDNGDGTFTAAKKTFFEFSDLDLYLMGLIPAQEVQPWFLIENPTNCIDSALPDGSCAPEDGFLFSADSYTVTGSRRDITVDHVIAAEGERIPAWPNAPSTYDVSFLLIKRPDEELSEAELRQVDTIIERSVEIFNDQTRGLAQVVNRTAAEDPTGGTGSTGGSDSAGESAGEDTGETSGSASDGTSGSGGDATAGPSTATATDADTDDAVEQTGDGDDGCGCRSTPAAPIPGVLGLLALLGLRRRRSTSACA